VININIEAFFLTDRKWRFSLNKSLKPSFLIFLLGFVLSIVPASVEAWKPITHVYLTLICRQDALDDGKLIIYEMDYESGQIVRDAQGRLIEIGRYEVDPFILRAIRQYPEHLKAGAVGTDLLPDLITAQTIVHPDNSRLGKTISDQWLTLIWEEARKSYSPQAIAFAAGYLAHAAGDLFGHTFINHYAGGPWQLGPNALKHIVLEAYLDKRTPINEPDFFRISIRGLENFLYKNLTVHPLIWTKTDNILDAQPFNFSPPRLFLFLQNFLREKQNSYSQTLRQKDKEYEAQIKSLLAEAAGCLLIDPVRSNMLTMKAAALQGEWQALKTSLLAMIAYLRAWINDIDRGLRAWPEFGRRIAENVFFCQTPNKDEAKEACQDFMSRYGWSMLGVPDVIGETQAFYQEIWRMVPKQIRDLIDFFSTDPLLFLLEKALGITWEYVQNPEVHFDRIMNNSPGIRITLSDFNRDVLKITYTGYSSSETYDWRNIPAMVNTVTMTKLAWLSENGLRELLKDLEEKGYTSNTLTPLIKIEEKISPLILGFMKSLDHSNQWCEGQKLLFVLDPCVYRKLFLKQIGENIPGCLGECETPPDGSIVKSQLNFPLAPGFKEFDVAVDKNGRLWQWGKLYLATTSGGQQVFKEIEVPALKEPLADIVQATSSRHPQTRVYVLKKDGTVWVWGSGAHVSAGLRETKDEMEPVPIPNLKSIVQVASGTHHCLALRSNGQVWAWGDNSRGQIGWGQRWSPARPQRVLALNHVKFIACGDYSSYAITQDGSLWVWGDDLSKPENDPNRNVLSPQKVSGINNVKMVAPGSMHVVVLKEEGTVWTWGKNSWGEIGDGTKGTFCSQPVQVKNLKDVMAVAAANFFSVALKKDGTVWVWGYHYYDPDRKKYYSELPVQVKELPKVVAIACGEYHTLALDKDGYVWCFGADKPEPKKISGLKLF
jgi:alpha-tubulin suppressor-like RCC1 family protein